MKQKKLKGTNGHENRYGDVIYAYKSNVLTYIINNNHQIPTTENVKLRKLSNRKQQN